MVLRKARHIVEVNCVLPALRCLKVNTYDVVNGLNGGGRGAFRTSKRFIKGCFCAPFEGLFAFEPELYSYLCSRIGGKASLELYLVGI